MTVWFQSLLEAERKFFRGVLTYGLLSTVKFIFVDQLMLPWGLRRRSSRLVAHSFVWSFRPLEKSGFRKGIPIIILIPKLGGEEDFLAALGAKRTNSFQAVKLPRSTIAKVYNSFVSARSVHLRQNSYAQLSREERKESESYADFLSAVFRNISRRYKISAVVTANVSYVAQREVALAARQSGIPFLVLHKECVKSKRQRWLYERFYRELYGEFAGTAVAVYNQDERDSLLKSMGLEPESIVVTGCARIDALHDKRKLGENRRDKVLLYTIDDRVGVLSPIDAFEFREWPNWASMSREVEDWFVAFAKLNPHRDFIMKVKAGTEKQVAARVMGPLPRNVSMVYGGSGGEVISQARVVIAFNSTVVLEALASGLPVLVPDAKSWFGDRISGWVHNYGDAVNSFSSWDSFQVMMGEALARSDSSGFSLPTGSRAQLRKFVGNDDGAAAIRTLNFIERFADL